MKTDLAHDAAHTNWAWQEVGCSASPCPRSRFKHAVCVSGCYVYVCGGKDGRTPLKDLWRFHLGYQTWEAISYRGEQLPHLEGHTLVAYQRLILIFGGQLSDGLHGPPLWILNTDLLHVRKISGDDEMSGGPVGRRDHTAVLYNGAMYVYGGFVDLKGSSPELWVYFIHEERWMEVKSKSGETPGGRHGHSALVEDNSMWITGGMNGLTVKSDVWKFTFTMKTWQRMKCFGSPPPVTGHSAHVINNVMYIIGGEVQGEVTNDIWCLPLDSLTWRKLSTTQAVVAMPPCTQHAAVWIDNRANHQSAGCRCRSEPHLGNTSHPDWVEMRPMSSPPAPAITKSQSVQFDQITPATLRRDISLLDCIASTQRHNSNRKREDEQALVQPVSRESENGVDNIVVSLQDEQLETTGSEHIKYWNEKCLVEIQVDENHFSMDQSPDRNNSASRSHFNEEQIKSNEMNCHIYNKNNHGRKQYVHNSVFRNQHRASKSHPRELTDNCPNPCKAIRSYLCDDLYVEDLEMVSVADFVGCVTFTGEFHKKGHQCLESIELGDMTFDNIPYNSDEVKETFSCDSDICHVRDDYDSSLHSGNNKDLPCKEEQTVISAMDCKSRKNDTHRIQDKQCTCICQVIQSNVDSNTNVETVQSNTNHQLKQSNINLQPIQSDTICQSIENGVNVQSIQSNTDAQLKQRSQQIPNDINHQTVQASTTQGNPIGQALDSGRLVSAGTQTDISQLCLLDCCESQSVDQLYAKPTTRVQVSSTFTDSSPCSGWLLVVGGKVSHGCYLSKPMSMWAAEIY